MRRNNGVVFKVILISIIIALGLGTIYLAYTDVLDVNISNKKGNIDEMTDGTTSYIVGVGGIKCIGAKEEGYKYESQVSAIAEVFEENGSIYVKGNKTGITIIYEINSSEYYTHYASITVEEPDLTVSPTSLTMTLNGEEVVGFLNCTNTVAAHSMDNSIVTASMQSAGEQIIVRVTAIKAGTTNIKLTANNGGVVYIPVTVTDERVSVIDSTQVNQNATVTITGNYIKNVQSNNNNVAQIVGVNKDGSSGLINSFGIKGISVGDTTITVTGKLGDTKDITVYVRAVSSVTVSEQNVRLGIGETKSITGGNIKDVNSNNTNIAQIVAANTDGSNGLINSFGIKGISVGTTTITVTGEAGDVETINVTVATSSSGGSSGSGGSGGSGSGSTAETYTVTAGGFSATGTAGSTVNIPGVSPIYYTVSFNGNGGSTPGNISSARYGWWAIASGQGNISGNTFTFGNSNATLVAQYNSTGSAITLPSATREGWNLEGWYNGATRVGGAGNGFSPSSSVTLRAEWIDNIPPTIGDITESVTEWTNQNVTITAKAIDKGTGISYYQFSKEDNLTASSEGWQEVTNTTAEITQTYEIEENGTYYFYAKDAVGNVNKKAIEITNIDKTIPRFELGTYNGALYVNKDATINVPINIVEKESGLRDSDFDIIVKAAGQEITYINKEITKIGENEGIYSYNIKLYGLRGDGKLSFTIVANEIQDIAGNYNAENVVETQINVDNTVPTVVFTPNGNTTWAQSHTTKVLVTDNISEETNVSVRYNWKLDGQLVDEQVIVSNVKEGFNVNKNTGTGKFVLEVIAIDQAQNIGVVSSEEFYIDNSITIPGEILGTVETKDGIVYIDVDKKEGDFTTQKIYATLIDGIDEESGMKNTTYKVVVNGEEVIKAGATADIIFEEKNIYEITVTTTDYAGNTIDKTYIVKILKPDMGFEPNGKTTATRGEDIVVTPGNIPADSRLSYTVVSVEKDEKKEETINKVKEGTYNWTTYDGTSPIKISGLNGIYVIVIKVEYPSTGEVEYVVSNKYILDNQIDKLATVSMKINGENGEEYTPGEVTKENVYIKLNNDAEDLSGIANTWFSVTGNDKVTTYTNGVAALLFEEGTYTITVYTKDNLGNIGTKEYIVKIDKTGPQVTFNKTSDGVTIVINEDKDYDSKININNVRYYWTQNYYKTGDLIEADFYGVGENTYRGRVNGTNGSSINQTIARPQESGTWILWVYVEDNAGNSTIIGENDIVTGDNVVITDKSNPIPGKITAIQSDGTEYVFTEEDDKFVGTYTNKDIALIINNGYDAFSSVESKVYLNGTLIKTIDKNQLNKDNNFVIKVSDLNVHREHTIRVVATDKSGNSTTENYVIKMDKQAPTIQVNKVTDYLKNEYATKHQVIINVQDLNVPTSGVNESSLKYIWVKTNETEITEEEKTNVRVNGTIFTIGETITTPEEATGTYYLIIYAEDNCENESYLKHGAYKLDNTIPTKPEVNGYVNTLHGTKEVEEEYYGYITGKDVIVRATDSISESGVDRYEFTYTTDNGKTWTEWTDCTKVKEDIKFGEKIISENGRIVIKFRGISTLADTELIGEESIEFTMVLDKLSPEVTFDKNGKEEISASINVTVSVTDNYEVNENSLKYQWVKEEQVTENMSQKDLINLITNPTTFINGAKISIDYKTVEEGHYKLIIYAEDIYGNKTIAVSNRFYIGKTDKIAPEVTFDKNGQEEIAESVQVTVSVIDNNEVNENSLKYKWVKENQVTENMSQEDLINLMTNSTTFINGAKISIDKNEVEEGYYKLIVYAEDIYENITISVSNRFHIGTIDRIAPTVTFANTTNGENGKIDKTEKVQVRVTVTDNEKVNKESLRYSWVKFESQEEYDQFIQKASIDDLKNKMVNSKKFSNGEPIPSEDGSEGIYSLFIYAEDEKGNSTVISSNTYYLGIVYVEYEYENAYIKKVKPNTTVEKFLNNAKQKLNGTVYRVYDKNGKELSNNDLITTSSRLVVDNEKTYTIAVLGDLNADGKINMQDVVKLRKAVVGLVKLEKEYIFAADVTGNEKINIQDVIKLRKATVQLVEL